MCTLPGDSTRAVPKRRTCLGDHLLCFSGQAASAGLKRRKQLVQALRRKQYQAALLLRLFQLSPNILMQTTAAAFCRPLIHSQPSIRGLNSAHIISNDAMGGLWAPESFTTFVSHGSQHRLPPLQA